MADSKKFSDVQKGEFFDYNGSHYRKVSNTHAANPKDDAQVYPLSGTTVVSPISEEEATGAKKADENAQLDNADHTQALSKLTVDELKELADENEVAYAGNVRKDDLVKALNDAGVKPPE